MSSPGRITLTFDIAVRPGNEASLQELVLELPQWIGDVLDHRPDVTGWKVTKNLDLPRVGRDG